MDKTAICVIIGKVSLFWLSGEKSILVIKMSGFLLN